MGNDIPPTFLIKERNFHNGWAKAVHNVINYGVEITFGSKKEPKTALDTCQIVEFTGPAIKQIEERELHPRFPFRTLKEYCKEFTREFLKDYAKKSDKEKFSYLYINRLIYYPVPNGFLDQLVEAREALAEQIKSGISSNRDQMITWIPEIDFGTGSPPCLQRIWFRYLGDGKVVVHLTWRSRDLFAAWQSNIICVIDMLNREIFKPNNCQIVKIIDYSDSLHIYSGSLGQAKEVKLVPISPQEMVFQQ